MICLPQYPLQVIHEDGNAIIECMRPTQLASRRPVPVPKRVPEWTLLIESHVRCVGDRDRSAESDLILKVRSMSRDSSLMSPKRESVHWAPPFCVQYAKFTKAATAFSWGRGEGCSSDFNHSPSQDSSTWLDAGSSERCHTQAPSARAKSSSHC